MRLAFINPLSRLTSFILGNDRSIRPYIWLAVLALGLFFIGDLAWPLLPGRDCGNYLAYYLDFFSIKPAYHFLMLYRMPLVPWVWGPVLEFLGVVGGTLLGAALYVISILAVYQTVSYWGRELAFITALLTLALIPHAWLYHTVSSESLFSTALILWLALVVRSFFVRINGRNTVVIGGMAALISFIRPSGQVLIPAFILILCFRSHISWRDRFRHVTLFISAALVPLLMHASMNCIRYNDFTVARGGAFAVPFHRVFSEGLVRPENGPVSRELIDAVNKKLLTREPYVSNRVTSEMFFNGKPKWRRIRMLHDLAWLSDNTWGWNSDHRMIRKAAFEAIKSHPILFTKSVLLGLMQTFKMSPGYPASLSALQSSSLPLDKIIDSDISPLKDEFIPHGYFFWMLSSPEASLMVKPIPPYDSIVQLEEATRSRMPIFPIRTGNDTMAGALNYIGQVALPSVDAWLILGLFGMILRPPPNSPVLLLFIGLALLVPVISIAGIEEEVAFRTVCDPLFLTFGMVSLWGGSVNRH